jgi:hypothetical protein
MIYYRKTLSNSGPKLTAVHQHQINQKQFTKEVRYLNWKYPQADMKSLLPQYKAEFHRLYPQAQLPFSEELDLSWATQLLYRYLDKSSKQ